MAELPERFDSKRELDAWLAKHVSELNDVKWRTVNMSGKEALTCIDDAYTEPQAVPPYTTDREAALDLLYEFCEQYDLDLQIEKDWIGIYKIDDDTQIELAIGEDFTEDYTIDPLAVSVAIYRAFQKIEEE